MDSEVWKEQSFADLLEKAGLALVGLEARRLGGNRPMVPVADVQSRGLALGGTESLWSVSGARTKGVSQ